MSAAVTYRRHDAAATGDGAPALRVERLDARHTRALFAAPPPYYRPDQGARSETR